MWFNPFQWLKSLEQHTNFRHQSLTEIGHIDEPFSLYGKSQKIPKQRAITNGNFIQLDAIIFSIFHKRGGKTRTDSRKCFPLMIYSVGGKDELPYDVTSYNTWNITV